MSRTARTLTAAAVAAALAGALATAPGPAAAQAAREVPVRTALHADFTRIAIDFPTRRSFALGRVGTGYELRIDGAAMGFDLSDVWRRIDGRRLAGLRDLGGGRLAIDTDCTCRLRTQRLAPGMLVIDVIDGAAGADNPYEVALDGGAAARPALRPGDDPAAGADTSAGGEDATPVPPPVLPEGGLPPLAGAGAPVLLPGRLTAAIDPDTLDAERLRRVDETRRKLLDQIARGAAQGVVKVPQQTLDHLLAPPVAPPAPTDAPAPAPEDDAPEDDLSMRPNVRIETQVDRDRNRFGRGGRKPRVACPPDASVDLASWGDDDLLATGLGAGFVRLLDEADRPDPAAYATLARQMLWMTFGAEARALVDRAPEDTPDRALLAEMASLMDGPGARAPALEALVACPGPAAIWGALAVEDLGDSGIDTVGLRRGFSALPPHLRHHLGPRLADRFLAAGDRDTALALRAAVDRAPPESPQTEVELMTARIEMAEGDRPAAEAGLAQVAASTGDDAAEALIELIDSRIASEAQVGIDRTDDAAALAYQYAGSDRGRALKAAEIRGLTHDDRIDKALDTLGRARVRDELAPEVADQLEDAIFARLVRLESDADFLKWVAPILGEGGVPGPSRLDVSERLLGLGLPELARKALGTGHGVPDARERRLLAEIAIADGRPQVAVGYLAGLSDPESEALRARALTAPRRDEPAPEAAAEPPAPMPALPGPAAPVVSAAMPAPAPAEPPDTVMAADAGAAASDAPGGPIAEAPGEGAADPVPLTADLPQGVDGTVPGAPVADAGPGAGTAATPPPSAPVAPVPVAPAPDIRTAPSPTAPPAAAPTAGEPPVAAGDAEEDTAEGTEPPGVLARNREALSKSREMRDSISRLLSGAPDEGEDTASEPAQ